MLKLIVLDIIGTTISDSQEIEACIAQACRENGLDVSIEEILQVRGYAKKQIFERLWKSKLGEANPSIAQKVEDSYATFQRILTNYYENALIKPTEGAVELFEFYKQLGIKVALTTGLCRRITELVLKKSGWLKSLNEQKTALEPSALISTYISSDEVPQGRPAPDLVFRAMEILDIDDPKTVAVVGDAPSDLLCGKNANALITIGVTSGAHSREELSQHPHDYLVSSLKALPAILFSYL